MLETLPRAILLDIRPEYAQFKQKAAPYLLGTTTTPEAIVEELWEALFDSDTMDERLLDTVVDISKRPQLQHAALPDIEPIVHDLAEVMYHKLGNHKLYGDRGYLPFNMSVEHEGLLVLKVDEHLDKVQQEFDEGDKEDEADEVLRMEFLAV
jgi:hypothetical protein